jgi:ribosomal protein S12 methylthiotransferase
VTGALIESIAALDKVCHYLDMPLQHISDRILRSMRRGTTRDSTHRLIAKLRDRIPDLAIRTTLIVGYPGEGEREFRELLSFIEEACFERLGIFTYSQETGSLAATLAGQVSGKVKEERLERGMLLQQRIAREMNQRLVGECLEVLIEEKEETPGLWTGRTYRDAPEVDGMVYLKADGLTKNKIQLKPGEFVNARITDTREYDLVAEPVGPFSA